MCLNYFSHCFVKLQRKAAKEGRIFWAHSFVGRVGNSKWQEQDVVGHIASAIRDTGR